MLFSKSLQKSFFYGLAFASISALSYAEGPGPGPEGHPPTPEQVAAMQACVAKKGVKLPELPKPTAAQRAAFEACRGSSGREEFEKCMKSKGVSKPPQPKLSPEQMKALHECRQELHK